jgi:ElaB/YqjD/DUF883 family membrane-anchored ribosome-binding protein
MTREDMDFIESLFRSLEKELKGNFSELKEEFHAVEGKITSRLDHANARLERIGGLVNGGSRAVAKMIEWSERTDVTLGDVLRRQTEFEHRLDEIERRLTPPAA